MPSGQQCNLLPGFPSELASTFLALSYHRDVAPVYSTLLYALLCGIHTVAWQKAGARYTQETLVESYSRREFLMQHALAFCVLQYSRELQHTVQCTFIGTSVFLFFLLSRRLFGTLGSKQEADVWACGQHRNLLIMLK